MKKIIGLLFAIMLGTAFLAVRSKPVEIPLEQIDYEEVVAVVSDIKTRTVRASKYRKRTYYDVYLQVDDKQYKWTALYDPAFRKGFQYPFFLCDGSVYRTTQEMTHELTIQSSSIAFRTSVLVSLCSFSLMITLIFRSLLIRRKKLGANGYE